MGSNLKCSVGGYSAGWVFIFTEIGFGKGKGKMGVGRLDWLFGGRFLWIYLPVFLCH
jgi:hypothetical protein